MKATITGSALLSVLILTVTLAAPAPAAQEPPAQELPDEPGLTREVWRLNATLTQLVTLLRRQVESSNATVLMQRVQLMTARIAPLEEELRAARSDQQTQENAMDDLELSITSMESNLELQVEEERITAEEARALIEQQEKVIEQRRKQLEDRLWEVKQRVVDLEQRLDERRTVIETWEGEIDRALGLR